MISRMSSVLAFALLGLVLTFVEAAGAVPLPEGFKLFSGDNDLTGLTMESFSQLCNTNGIQCDKSGGIIMVNGPELGTEVKSLEELKFMPRLKSLVLNDMDLTMLFPTEICTLEHLQELDLSGNNFLGTIPPCVCNLAYLMYFDLSENRFQGALPECINGMANVRDINLRCNVMEEPLPESLNYIKTIEAVNYTCNDYKEYQATITVPEYKAGDINCNQCMQHAGTCPDELYQYGSGTYVASTSEEPSNEEEEVKPALKCPMRVEPV